MLWIQGASSLLDERQICQGRRRCAVGKKLSCTAHRPEQTRVMRKVYTTFRMCLLSLFYLSCTNIDCWSRRIDLSRSKKAQLSRALTAKERSHQRLKVPCGCRVRPTCRMRPLVNLIAVALSCCLKLESKGPNTSNKQIVIN